MPMQTQTYEDPRCRKIPRPTPRLRLLQASLKHSGPRGLDLDQRASYLHPACIYRLNIPVIGLEATCRLWRFPRAAAQYHEFGGKLGGRD